jgi:hypothetical protein
MIVSHRHRIIFLKTEKTGGTSVERALATLLGEGDVWPSGPRPAWGRRAPGLHGALTRTLPEVFGPHAHATARQVRRIVGRAVFDSYLKVSIERNPWDRQVSLYTHREWKKGRGPENFDRDMRSLRYRTTEYCRLDNWSIYAIGDAIVADRVLRHERLAEDFAALMAELGVVEPPALGRHRAYNPDRPHYSAYYSAETRDLVARWYAREIAAFGYEFEDAPAAAARPAA